MWLQKVQLTAEDVWRVARQLPNSELVKWINLIASTCIVIASVWSVASRLLRRDNPEPDDNNDFPEGA